MDYSGLLHQMYALDHLFAVRKWVDKMVTSILLHPALEMHINCLRFSVYYGAFLVYTIYFMGASIYNHRKYWYKPDEQQRIVVLVSIPAVIGFVSWVQLHLNEDYKTLFLLLDSIKECSAGLGIPMFMGLLQAYMNLNTSKLSPDAFRQKIRGRLISNFFPVTLVQPRFVALDQNNLKLLNFWTWQYVVIRLVCTVFMIAFQLCGMYPLWLSWAFFLILNLSALVAYYTAYAFYHAFDEDFPRLSYGRFLYIKFIFFFCFWQGGVLKVLVATGLLWQELHNSLLVFESFMPLTMFHWTYYTYAVYIDYHLPLKMSPFFSVMCKVH